MNMPLRHLSSERLQWARDVFEAYRQSGKTLATTDNLDVPIAWGTLLLHEQFGDRTHETIDLHVGCFDELAFAAIPCELFTHFALEIRRRSPFAHTAIFGITNGEMGYCPTTEGLIGGDWGSALTLTSRWDEIAGYRLVDEVARRLCELKTTCHKEQ